MEQFDIKESQRLRNRVLRYILIPLFVLDLILVSGVYLTGRNQTLQMQQTYLDEGTEAMADKIYNIKRSTESTLQYQIIRSGLLEGKTLKEERNPAYVKHRLRNYVDYMNVSGIRVESVYYCDADDGQTCIAHIYDNDALVLNKFLNSEAYDYWRYNRLDMFPRAGSVVWRRFQDRPDYVYLYKYVLDPETMQYRGMLCTVLKASFVEKMLEYSDRHDVIYDENGNLLCGDSELLTLEAFEKNYKAENISIFSMERLPRRGWYLVAAVPRGSAFKELYSIMEILLPLVIGSFLLFLLTALVLTRAVTRNIDMLSANFHRIQNGEKPLELKPVSEDETAALCLQFNYMQHQLEENAAQMAEDNTLLERAEYNALMGQLNPHFLYNCLESISAMARMRGQTEIVTSIQMLSGMLRQALRERRQEIPLSEELDYIRRYLILHSNLTGGELAWDMDADEQAQECLIPRLMLQPLVENAIVHGLKDRIEEGMIVITARVEEQEAGTVLQLLVADNGVGAPAEEIERLLKMEGREESRAHIGVRNIQRRIQILYGEDYGLQIESDVDSGTIVRVRIPYHTVSRVDQADGTK